MRAFQEAVREDPHSPSLRLYLAEAYHNTDTRAGRTELTRASELLNNLEDAWLGDEFNRVSTKYEEQIVFTDDPSKVDAAPEEMETRDRINRILKELNHLYPSGDPAADAKFRPPARRKNRHRVGLAGAVGQEDGVLRGYVLRNRDQCIRRYLKCGGVRLEGEHKAVLQGRIDACAEFGYPAHCTVSKGRRVLQPADHWVHIGRRIRRKVTAIDEHLSAGADRCQFDTDQQLF